MILRKVNWNIIYQNQSPELLALCVRYVKDKALAEDLLHDSFLTAIDKIDSFKNKGSFNGWLRKIVLNTVLQYLRQNNYLEINQNYDDNIMQDTHQSDVVFNKKHLIAQAAFSKEEILNTLNSLPEHHRIVFNLYVFEGYKHAQISKILEISVGTSKSCLSRARKKLIELLYAKAKEQVKEEEKKRKVLATLWILPFGDGFVDKINKRGLKTINAYPKQTFNFATKKIPLDTKGILLKTASLLILLSIIGVGIGTTNIPNKQFEEYKNCNNSLVFTSMILNVGHEEKLEEDRSLLNLKTEKDSIKLFTKDTLVQEEIDNDTVTIYKTGVGYYNIRKKESLVQSNRTTEKERALFTYYYFSNDADSTIIGREKIEFSTKKNKINDPVLQFYADSTFCFKYNCFLDTNAVLDPNTNELISRVFEESDKFCGRGWQRSNSQYANFIVQDTLRLQYRIYLRGDNKVLFVKELTFNIKNNRSIDNLPTVQFKKLNKNP